MAHSQFARDRPVLARVGSLVAGSTVALTMAFFGLIAIASGGAVGFAGRVPFYVLAAAVAFAVALFLLDRRRRDGRDLLVLSVSVAAVAFVLVTLGVEGLAFAVQRPAETVRANTLIYLLSVALVTTGLGYWGANHRRELARSIRR